jgi:hypothetical protein
MKRRMQEGSHSRICRQFNVWLSSVVPDYCRLIMALCISHDGTTILGSIIQTRALELSPTRDNLLRQAGLCLFIMSGAGPCIKRTN